MLKTPYKKVHKTLETHYKKVYKIIRGETILISILIMFGFILFFELFVILLSIDSVRIIFSWDLVHKVFLIALFAGPSLIILLPIIYLVGECLS